MAKLKNPLLSLRASGTLARAITFLRRNRVDLAEKTPKLIDARSAGQLAWRPMFLKCVDLWHSLTTAEKQAWEKAARPKHLTGYAWYISQCLKPNPGIYLPLAGGSMTGDIDMDAHRILEIPDPLLPQEPATKAYADAITGGYTQGARVYHDANETTATGTWKTLAFNSERYDTDGIHDNVANNSRLTCKTSGKYLITAITRWPGNPTGQRRVEIRLNGTTSIGYHMIGLAGAAEEIMNPTCIYALAVNDYVEIRVYQTSGGDLDVVHIANYSPEFMMQRIG